MALVKGVKIDYPYVKVTAAPSGGGSLVAGTDREWVEGTAHRADPTARYGTWIITESSMGAAGSEAAAVVESLVRQGYRVDRHDERDWILELADPAAPEVDDAPFGFGLVEPPQAKLSRWLQRRQRGGS